MTDPIADDGRAPAQFDLGDDYPAGISKGLNGGIVAEFPYTSKSTGRAGVTKRTFTGGDITRLMNRIGVDRKSARRLVIDTFEEWTGSGHSGFDDWLAKFIAACVARHESGLDAEADEPDDEVEADGENVLNFEQYMALERRNRGAA